MAEPTKEQESTGSPTTDAVREQVDPDVDGRATKKKQDEEFKNQQQLAAAGQGMQGENAVPEQRPIASQQVLDNHHQSALYRGLKEAGELQSQEEPMGREAYERASSDSQIKKAGKESRTERLWEGQRVRVLREPYVNHGAVGHILRVEYGDFNESQRAASGDPGENRFAEVESYVVKLRGGYPATLDLKPDEVQVIQGADMGRTET